jgi:hypothetical protein
VYRNAEVKYPRIFWSHECKVLRLSPISFVLSGERALLNTSHGESKTGVAEVVPLKCPSCGAPVQRESTHCEFCGTELMVIRGGAKSITSQGDLDNLGGHEFEDLIEHLLVKMGFATEGRKRAADGGIDIVAVSSQPVVSGRYIIQCKRYSNSVSSPIVRDLYGVVMAERANKGILITTSAFTSDAIEFAHEKPIELIDGPRLIDLLRKYSLLGAEIQGPTSQVAVANLRNELVGLASSLEKKLQEAETGLVLDTMTFGDEHRLRTYTAYFDWFKKTNSRLQETFAAIMAIISNFNEFQRGAADLSGARRIRAQLEEVFQHLMSTYGQFRKARPPQILANSHEIYKNAIRLFIVDFVDFVKRSEEALEKGEKQVNFKMVLHADEFSRVIEEETKVIKEMQRRHQIR